MDPGFRKIEKPKGKNYVPQVEVKMQYQVTPDTD